MTRARTHETQREREREREKKRWKRSHHAKNRLEPKSFCGDTEKCSLRAAKTRQLRQTFCHVNRRADQRQASEERVLPPIAGFGCQFADNFLIARYKKQQTQSTQEQEQEESTTNNRPSSPRRVQTDWLPLRFASACREARRKMAPSQRRTRLTAGASTVQNVCASSRGCRFRPTTSTRRSGNSRRTS